VVILRSFEEVLWVRLQVFTAVTMQNCVFWDVTPCGSFGISSQHVSVASYSELVTDSCHPDEGGAKFLRNVGSYKSHME
jgi:hypothetical protein